MDKPSVAEIELGTLTVTVQRVVLYRIPRALRLKQRLDEGVELSEYELGYLAALAEETRLIAPLLRKHPEWRSITNRMIQLCVDLSNDAMDNEGRRAAAPTGSEPPSSGPGGSR
jgi:hypothetical protein